MRYQFVAVALSVLSTLPLQTAAVPTSVLPAQKSHGHPGHVVVARQDTGHGGFPGSTQDPTLTGGSQGGMPGAGGVSGMDSGDNTSTSAAPDSDTVAIPRMGGDSQDNTGTSATAPVPSADPNDPAVINREPRAGSGSSAASAPEFGNLFSIPLKDFIAKRKNGELSAYDTSSDGCSVPYTGNENEGRSSGASDSDKKLVNDFFSVIQSAQGRSGNPYSEADIAAMQEVNRIFLSQGVWAVVQPILKNIANNPLGYSFGDACVRHDFGYRNAKLFPDQCANAKTSIDTVFKMDMDGVCAQTDDKTCYVLAFAYWAAVTIKGGDSYFCQ